MFLLASRKLDNWLAAQEQEQFQALLKERYLIESVDAMGRPGLKPIHVRIIEESGSELGSVAEALLTAAGGEQTEPRTLLAWLLAFVQDIPYNALESEDGSPGDRLSATKAGAGAKSRRL